MPQAVKNSRIVEVPTEPTGSGGKSFDRKLRDAIADHPNLVLLDCAALERVRSSHINLLWTANMLCREAEIELRLLNSPPNLLRILAVLDLNHTFAFEEIDNITEPQTDADILMARLPQSYTSGVKVEIAAIDSAINNFVAYLSKIGAGATTVHELRTIFYEIATNIRQYSGLPATENFSVEIAADKVQIMMTFIDNGRPFNSTTAISGVDADEAARSRKRRGFGLVMIRRLADRLEYRQNENGGNILTVFKKWRL